jgi:excisionase family DNA binding protein
VSLPVEVKAVLRPPLAHGYTLQKVRAGDGITYKLVSPTGKAVVNVPQTMRYPDRFRKFKAKMATLELDPTFMRDEQAVRVLLDDALIAEVTPVPNGQVEAEEPRPVGEVLITPEVAILLGVSTAHVSALVKDGKLRALTVPVRRHHTQFSRVDVEEYMRIRKRRGKPKSGPVTVTQIEPETETGKFRYLVKNLIRELGTLDDIKEQLEGIVRKYEEVVAERDDAKRKYDRIMKNLERTIDES